MKKNKKLKTILIGIGKQSVEDHIPALQDCTKADLVAIVDKNTKIAKEWSKKLKVPYYNSTSKAIKNHTPDFAIVAVPHNEYFKIINQLAKKKIHILKEKPFALDLQEGKKIQKIIKDNDIKLMVTLQRRFNPIFSSFIQLMKQIGRHFFIEAKSTLYIDSPNDGWRGERKKAGGGCIIDMGYHVIDLLIWYFGLPNQIHAEHGCFAKPDKHYDAEDTASIIFRYTESGLFGNLILSRFIFPKTGYLKLIGSNGTVEVKRGKLIRTNKKGDILEDLTRKKDWTAAATTQIDYFCEVIKGKKRNFGSPRYHLQHMAFIEACYKSQKTGKFINPHNLL